jgi:hypothetical protein
VVSSATWFVITALIRVGARHGTGAPRARDAGRAHRHGDQYVGVPRALLRTALIALVLPPFLRDTGRPGLARPREHARSWCGSLRG